MWGVHAHILGNIGNAMLYSEMLAATQYVHCLLLSLASCTGDPHAVLGHEHGLFYPGHALTQRQLQLGRCCMRMLNFYKI